MRSARLVWTELKYQQLAYWRNPIGAFFTFFMPVLFLVIFGALYSGAKLPNGGGLSLDQYFIPGILTFGVIAACYTNLAIQLTTQREEGILKRVRGTPLPAWAFLSATIGSSVVRAGVLVVITLGIGYGFYGLVVPTHALVDLSVVVVLAAATFCALGVAVTPFVPNADAAPAVVNGLYLPLMFLSGTFFPIGPRSTLAQIASWFPVRPFVLASFAALNPKVHAAGMSGHDLLALAIWGAVGVVVAVRRFSWVPRRKN